MHVRKPIYVNAPSSKKVSRKLKNDILTVFDTNKVLRDDRGLISGRGDYRSVPLKNVNRIKVNGVIYKIH